MLPTQGSRILGKDMNAWWPCVSGCNFRLRPTASLHGKRSTETSQAKAAHCIWRISATMTLTAGASAIGISTAYYWCVLCDRHENKVRRRPSKGAGSAAAWSRPGLRGSPRPLAWQSHPKACAAGSGAESIGRKQQDEQEETQEGIPLECKR